MTVLIPTNEELMESMKKALILKNKKIDSLEKRVKELEDNIIELKENVPKWISVNERFPKKNAIVYTLPNNMFAIYDDENNVFCYLNGYTMEVTHWMELPSIKTTDKNEKEA